MCTDSHCHGGYCHSRFFGAIKFVMFSIMLGTALGLIGLYFLDRDKFVREKAKKIFRNVENFTHDVQEKFNSPHLGSK